MNIQVYIPHLISFGVLSPRALATKLNWPSLQILLTHLSQAMQIPSALSATTYLVICPVLRGLNAQVAFLGSTPASSVPASHGLSFSSVHALFSDTRDQHQCLYCHTPSSPLPYTPCLDFPLPQDAGDSSVESYYILHAFEYS